MNRRILMAGTAALALLGPQFGLAHVFSGGMPSGDFFGHPPEPIKPGGWRFFTPEEAAATEALVERMIPTDPQTPGGRDAGCAVFIDRQLAGPYGSARGLYMRPPFRDGSPEQGDQSPLTPAQRFRRGLAELDKYCKTARMGKRFAELEDADKDQIITAMQKGPLTFESVSASGFFELLLHLTREGFFADPLYGGNHDMVGWRMIGFPGARYDHRFWIERHNEPYPLPPVSIQGRPEWGPA